MAKVIRNRWVYRPHGRWHRYLPRRNDAVKEIDFEVSGGSLAHFRENSADELDKDSPPSKLWMSWVYRDLSGEPKWTKKRIEKLFGTDWIPGRAEIFPNTEAINEELWHVKHLIELKPISFPNGVPTTSDIGGMKITPDGVCEISKEHHISEDQLKLYDATTQWSDQQLSKQLDSRYYTYQDVFEKNVYTPLNYVRMK